MGNFLLRLAIFFPAPQDAKGGDTQLEEEKRPDRPLAINPLLDALLCILNLFSQILPVKQKREATWASNDTGLISGPPLGAETQSVGYLGTPPPPNGIMSSAAQTKQKKDARPELLQITIKSPDWSYAHLRMYAACLTLTLIYAVLTRHQDLRPSI